MIRRELICMYVCIKFISEPIIHNCLFYYNVANELKKDNFTFMYQIERYGDSILAATNVFVFEFKILKVNIYVLLFNKSILIKEIFV